MTENSVPFEFRAIDSTICGQLFGCAPRTFLEDIACKPGFPLRVSLRPASWIAGEVIEWRDAHREELARRKRRKAA